MRRDPHQSTHVRSEKMLRARTREPPSLAARPAPWQAFTVAHFLPDPRKEFKHVRTTVAALRRRKAAGQPFTVLTAYDYTSARLVDSSMVDAILVGDSLGMVMQGHDSTLPVTVDEMIYHAKAVRRGAQRALIVVDLPFISTASDEDALRAATRIMAESGAQAVKLEGGERVAPLVRRLVQNGIPVMGHLGFTPQSVNTLGLRVQGKDEAGARALLADALALQEAGAWGLVLELVPSELAAEVSARLDIPTVGIGAGAGCDAQVQVWHDLLGLYEEFVPKHARQFRTLGVEIRDALNEYSAAVSAGTFPGPEHGSTMDPETLSRALGPREALPDAAGPGGAAGAPEVPSPSGAPVEASGTNAPGTP